MNKKLDELINRLYANDPELTKLDLHYYIEMREISHEKWEELCNALVSNTTVQTLILSRSLFEIIYQDGGSLNDSLHHERWVNLCKALKFNTSIKRLEMDQCNNCILDSDGLEPFLDVIITNQSITSISLRFNNIEWLIKYKGFNFQNFLDAIRMNQRLRELDITESGCGLFQDQAKRIIDFIKSSSLRIIRINWPDIIFEDKKRESESVSQDNLRKNFKEQFFKALNSNQRLEKVYLERHMYSNKQRYQVRDCQYLQETEAEINQVLDKRNQYREPHHLLLAAAHSLQKTKLPLNKFHQFLPKGLIQHILSFLGGPKALCDQVMRELDDHNNTPSKVTQRLFTQDPTLTKLSFSSRELWRLSEKRWAEFCNSLAQNRHLESLDLSLNGLNRIDSKMWDNFCKALAVNRSLVSIDLSHNFLQKLNLGSWFKLCNAVSISPGIKVSMDFCMKKENYKRYGKLGLDVLMSPISIPITIVFESYDLVESGVRRIKKKM